MKKKFICTVCGYIYEGTEAPEKCPVCKAPASKFKELEDPTDGPAFATVHTLGAARKEDATAEMIKDLETHFNGECGEVGMYLAMSRQADREGYPEIAEAFKRYAFEEAEHASKFAELLGDVLKDTKSNLEARIAAERGACEDKFRIAKNAKAAGMDATHDTVHEMAKDEARHCAGFMGLRLKKINRVGGKRSSFSPTFVFRPLTPPYMRFRIRRFLFWVPFEICPS